MTVTAKGVTSSSITDGGAMVMVGNGGAVDRVAEGGVAVIASISDSRFRVLVGVA